MSNALIFPEFDYLRNEVARLEDALYSGKLDGSPLHDVYLYQYTAAELILKAFYDEAGSPIDILEQIAKRWDIQSTYDPATSYMFSTMRDYALSLYDDILVWSV